MYICFNVIYREREIFNFILIKIIIKFFLRKIDREEFKVRIFLLRFVVYIVVECSSII